jgi:hypothetical protein
LIRTGFTFAAETCFLVIRRFRLACHQLEYGSRPCFRRPKSLRVSEIQSSLTPTRAINTRSRNDALSARFKLFLIPTQFPAALGKHHHALLSTAPIPTPRPDRCLACANHLARGSLPL